MEIWKFVLVWCFLAFVAAFAVVELLYEARGAGVDAEDDP